MFKKMAVLFVAVIVAASFATTLTTFVSKGDVQTALGWNNKQLQDGASSLSFTSVATTVSEVSWTCTNTNNQNVQERERTTTTSRTDFFSSIARERNQITGFFLTVSSVIPGSSTTEGPQLNSCPTNWVLTPAGAPEVISSTNQMFVNGVALP